jgi:hypothetical protein
MGDSANAKYKYVELTFNSVSLLLNPLDVKSISGAFALSATLLSAFNSSLVTLYPGLLLSRIAQLLKMLV